MRIVYTTFLLMLSSLSSIVFAQPITLKGRIITESGEPATGIAVVVKGTVNGTTVDSSGTFSIAVVKIPATLVFTGIGYSTVEYAVTVKSSQVIKLTIPRNTAALAEVVVTGYGTPERYDMAAPRVTIRGVSSLSAKASGLALASAPSATHMKLPASIKKEGLLSKVPRLKDSEARSKVLTAGEVSDFKKWKLWGDYSAAEFKTWSEHWGIAFKNRYCVQVQNQDHKALVGEKVYLVNNMTKDTVWYAITDNTGKAELWANVEDNKNENSTYTIVCNKHEIFSPAVFQNGINRITTKKPCYVSNMVDIAFVVDATGSMGDEIQYLQEELQDIISKTADKYTSTKFRTGAVFYRDQTDEYLTRYDDFQTDPSNLISFIKKQSAAGGGDMPEAVEDALTTALDSLHWNEAAHAKILFLVLDAPPHDGAKTRMNGLIKKAAKRGIRIVPVVCSGIDKSTEYLMRCIALATNGSYVFLTDDSGIGNPHIKPTTDEFTVELLNNLLQRLIGEMIYVPACDSEKRVEPVNDNISQEIKVVVYPNPTSGNINIEYSEQVKEIFITDFTGKVLMKVEATSRKKKVQLNLGNYPSGTYLAKYFVKDKGWVAEKVLLMH